MATFFDIPTSQIITRLLNNKKLKKLELDKIQNILFNFGFGMDMDMYFMDKFQYDNPVHTGILLGLLLDEKHDRLSPFYPLQQYPTQEAKVAEITKEWEKELLSVLKKSERTMKASGRTLKNMRKGQRTRKATRRI